MSLTKCKGCDKEIGAKKKVCSDCFLEKKLLTKKVFAAVITMTVTLVIVVIWLRSDHDGLYAKRLPAKKTDLSLKLKEFFGRPVYYYNKEDVLVLYNKSSSFLIDQPSGHLVKNLKGKFDGDKSLDVDKFADFHPYVLYDLSTFNAEKNSQKKGSSLVFLTGYNPEASKSGKSEIRKMVEKSGRIELNTSFLSIQSAFIKNRKIEFKGNGCKILAIRDNGDIFIELSASNLDVKGGGAFILIYNFFTEEKIYIHPESNGTTTYGVDIINSGDKNYIIRHVLSGSADREEIECYSFPSKKRCTEIEKILKQYADKTPWQDVYMQPPNTIIDRVLVRDIPGSTKKQNKWVLLDLATKKEIISFNVEPYTEVKFSPQDNYIIITNKANITILSAQNGKKIRTLQGFEESIDSIIMDPDEEIVFATGDPNRKTMSSVLNVWFNWKAQK